MAKEEKIIETSKQVVQSYLLTTAGRDWGVYAEKFLLRLIEIAQCDIQGMDFRKGTDMKPHNPSLNYPLMTRNEVGDAIITIPIKSLLPDEGYTNYEYIREAIEQLQTKVLRWEETKTDKNGNIVYNAQGNPVRKWTSVQLVGKATGEDDESGYITVRIDTDIWKAMVDFTKGFRAFDLNIAMKLQSKYALRLYQLLSRQDHPLTYTIEDLKKQWGLEDKYPRPDDFIKRTIIPAKEELDAVSPYTFDYVPVKSNAPGKGKKPVTSIIFYPKHQLQFDNPRGLKGFDETQVIKEPIRRILREKYGFQWYELETTFDILYAAQRTITGADEEHPELLTFIVELYRNAVKSNDKKKYLIGSLKKHLQEKYNYTIKSKKELAAEEKLRKMAENKAKKEAANEPKLLGDIFK